MDFPNKGWESLLLNLSQNTKHQDVDIQRSAVITLGYICDKLATSDFRLSRNETEPILYGIQIGLSEEQQNEEIKLTALKALQDSILLLSEILLEDEAIELIFTLILKNILNQNIEIAVKSVECLIDLYKTCYQKLTRKYMDVLAEKITGLLRSSAQISITIITTEFWNAAAILEAKLMKKQKFESIVVCHDHIKTYSVQITEALLECLTKKDNEDMESGRSIHGAAFEALVNVNSISINQNKDVNFKFIYQNMNTDDERAKICGLNCFEALVLSVRNGLEELILESLEGVFHLMSVSRSLCKASLKLLRAAAETYPKLILSDKICVEWLEKVMRIYQEEPSLASFVCDIIKLSAPSLSDPDANQAYFRSKSDHIVQLLLQSSMSYSDCSNLQFLHDSLTTSLWIVRSYKDQEKLRSVLGMFTEALGSVSKGFKELKDSLKEGILVNILTCIQQMKRHGVDRATVNADWLALVYDFCHNECTKNQSSFGDALLVMVSIAQCKIVSPL